MTALRLLLFGNFFSNRNLHVFSCVVKDVRVLAIDIYVDQLPRS
jgi:hypothetical protein